MTSATFIGHQNNTKEAIIDCFGILDDEKVKRYFSI